MRDTHAQRMRDGEEERLQKVTIRTFRKVQRQACAFPPPQNCIYTYTHTHTQISNLCEEMSACSKECIKAAPQLQVVHALVCQDEEVSE